MANGYKVVFTDKFDSSARQIKRKKSVLFGKLSKQIGKIIKNPEVGKPLRNVMRNYRRIHVGSFVLIYEIRDEQIRFIDFDHHDKIYKKYRT